MTYGVGVDLGTTFTAAAVRRSEGQVEMITLGRGSFAVPSALFALPDGEFLVGDVAIDRGREEPSRLAIEFKRRLGDSTSLLLGGAAYSADRLTAELLRWVLGVVTERQGEAPDHVVVTHPANWGEFRQDMMRGALDLAGVPDATLITEPEAAALHYAARERVDPGELVAVYDLGGGTFDAVVLERTAEGFTTRGTPRGIERLGGVDLDQIVKGMVIEHLNTDLSALDPSDPSVAADLVDLHSQCVQAKVALSSDQAATVRVRLADERADIRVTRTEFEERAAPTLQASVDALQSTIAGAGVGPTDIAKILLVGGSSRIPLIAEMVFDALNRPVAVDADPKAAVALGAAHVAGDGGVGTVPITETVPSSGEPEQHEPEIADPVPPTPPPPETTDPRVLEPDATAGDEKETESGPSPEPPELVADVVDERADGPGWRRRWWMIPVGTAAVVLVVIGFVVFRGGDDPDDEVTSSTTSSSSVPDPVEFTDLRIQNEIALPFDTEVAGRQFTAISGLAFDPEAGVHLAVKGAPRFADRTEVNPEPLLFTIEVSDDEVTIVDAVELTGEDGQPYGVELDAEGLALLDDGSFVILSEGETDDDGEPFIHRHARDGTFLDSFEIPDTYITSGDLQRGIGPQGGFTSLALVPGRDLLVAGIEYPLSQDDSDDPLDQKVVRLLGYDVETGEAVREWGYPLDQISEDNVRDDDVRGGLLELIAVDEQTLLALERSHAEPGSSDFFFALYQIELTDGVAPSESLPAVLDKRLIWSDTGREEMVGTFDTASRGAPTSDGGSTLVFATDCEFRECDTRFVLAALEGSGG